MSVYASGHHLVDFWTNMCLNHNLITEGELDTEDFRCVDLGTGTVPPVVTPRIAMPCSR